MTTVDSSLFLQPSYHAETLSLLYQLKDVQLSFQNATASTRNLFLCMSDELPSSITGDNPCEDVWGCYSSTDPILRVNTTSTQIHCGYYQNGEEGWILKHKDLVSLL